MRRDSAVQLVAAILLVVFLGSAGVSASAVSASVGANKLSVTMRAEEGDPPQVGLGIAMGAFRGFFVNYLWIRANQLKEAGRYHEAMNLSRAITTLQPRFPRVWAFHAWNMAYNISVTANNPAERWEWVNKGIRLLRDEGIQANPSELLLYRELAYIFQHKIQGYTDDSNQYYKRAMAAEWTFVLGNPPPPGPDMRDRDYAIEAYAGWIESIADAPTSVTRAADADESVASLLQELRAIEVEPGLELLERYEVILAIERSARAERIQAEMGPRYLRQTELMDDPAYEDAWDTLIRTVRRRVLIENYHMDPRRMARYIRKFGPIDFRHPAGHGAYWSHKGTELSLRVANEQNADDLDVVNTDRGTMHSLQELYRSGEIYFDLLGFTLFQEAERTTYVAVPNVHFVESYGIALEESANRGGIFEDQSRRGYTHNSAGYQNFLEDVVRLYYRRGERAKAEDYYRKLRTWEGRTTNVLRDEFAVTMDEFIQNQFKDERFTQPSVAVSEVFGALQGAFASGLLAGDTELFDSQLAFAREFHAGFMEYHFRNTPATGGTARMEVMDRDFRLVAGEALARFITLIDLTDAETVYLNAPVSLKQFAYVALRQVYQAPLDAAVERGDPGARPFADIFPEPPGIPAFLDYLDQKIAERESRLRMDGR
ncbi:MAG: hypothetical protein AAGB51_12240 [Planctomycetota bacterium]